MVMTDLTISLISSAVLIIGIAIVSLVALKGWSQWIALRRTELEGAQGHVATPDPEAMAGSRIELADLRERVRTLEAIAAGVDL
jgi:hypothetical protein